MIMEYDFSKRKRDFNMTKPVVVSSTGKGDPIVAFVDEWGGRECAHIRSLYQNHNGEWCPGKGLSFPVEEMTDVLLKLAERFVVADDDKTLSPQQHYVPPKKLLDQAYAAAERQKPKMSNGLEGLAKLKSSMGKKAAPARFKSESRRSR
jgi:Transcriptional Coactivator p15 (PC4)